MVYLDESSWKVGSEGCSLWAFAAQWQRVFLFGCHKDGDTLDTILPPDLFTGVGVSDDAAVYRDRFLWGQKCWAHLLRKAIRLALLYPRRKRISVFWTGSWSCTATPNEWPWMGGWAKRLDTRKWQPTPAIPYRSVALAEVMGKSPTRGQGTKGQRRPLVPA